MLFCAVMLGLNTIPQRAFGTNTYGFPLGMAQATDKYFEKTLKIWCANAALNAGFLLVNVLAMAACFEWLARKTSQNRAWYLLHGQTVLVLIIVGCLWIAANLVSRGLVVRDRWFFADSYGFPYIYYVESQRNTDEWMVREYILEMYFNVYIALMTLLFIGFITEFFVRRRSNQI